MFIVLIFVFISSIYLRETKQSEESQHFLQCIYEVDLIEIGHSCSCCFSCHICQCYVQLGVRLYIFMRVITIYIIYHMIFE